MGEEFEVVEPEDIRKDKMSVPYLILRQLDRINRILSIDLANAGEKKLPSYIAMGAILGLRCIEAQMSSELPPEYADEVKPIKKKLERLGSPRDWTVDNAFFQWYNLLIKNLPRVNLGITEEKDFVFEE